MGRADVNKVFLICWCPVTHFCVLCIYPVFFFSSWKQTVDASKSIEDLHREIKSIAEKTMQEVQNKPLGELWK